MDYTKQCWYCGKVTMVNKGDYYQCTECGATWSKPPQMLEGGLVLTTNPSTGEETYTLRPLHRATKKQPRKLPKSELAGRRFD